MGFSPSIPFWYPLANDKIPMDRLFVFIFARKVMICFDNYHYLNEFA